jgi:transposase
MAKTFRPWDVEQCWLLPPSVNELVPEGHLAHFVRETFRDELDLSAVKSEYEEERGFPPFHPVMMSALLLTRTARACTRRGASPRLASSASTSWRSRAAASPTSAQSRSFASDLPALAALFEQVLRLCRHAGMVQLGHVALDGTKVKANASKRKAMSYGRMKETEPRLAMEVQSWFERADQLDAEDDAELGERRGDELPEWVVNKEQRRQRIQAAMAQLEREATPPDDEPSPPRGGRPSPNDAPATDAKPADKSQLNFTDPQSKIMKTSDGFIQGYNCQAAVDGATQVIVAYDVVARQSDTSQLVPMLDAIRRSLGRNPRELSADNGYCSEHNMHALHRRRIRGYVAVKKERIKSKTKPRRRATAQGRFAVAMRRRIDRGGFRSRYRLRKQIVEPVFGQIKSARQLASFSLRGLANVRGEWALLCTAHNI